MLKILRNAVLSLAICLIGGLVLVPASGSAASPKSDACAGINQLSGGSGSDCSKGADKAVSSIIKTVITILSIVVGFIAVIMVIVGGLKMITANGDSNAVASARSTIIYALVGLIIVAIAQVLVHFVLFKTKQAL